MSHYSCLVIGDKPESLLAPFEENLNVEWVDMTQKYKDTYENDCTHEFFDTSNSSWGYELTEEMFKRMYFSLVGTTALYTINSRGLCYLKNNSAYKGCYRLEDGTRCEDDVWFKVIEINSTDHPDKDVCFNGTVTLQKIEAPKEIPLKEAYPDYNDYLEEYQDVEDMDNIGYYHNPNAKWDWYQLGGGWSHLLVVNTGDTVDSCIKSQLDIQATKEKFIEQTTRFTTYAILDKDGWQSKAEMGWFGCSYDESMTDEQWVDYFNAYFTTLSEDAVISIYDLHI